MAYGKMSYNDNALVVRFGACFDLGGFKVEGLLDRGSSARSSQTSSRTFFSLHRLSVRSYLRAQLYGLFYDLLDFQLSIISRLSIWMGLDLSTFSLGGEHHDDSYILLPHNSPKIVEGLGNWSLGGDVSAVGIVCFDKTGIDIVTLVRCRVL